MTQTTFRGNQKLPPRICSVSANAATTHLKTSLKLCQIDTALNETTVQTNKLEKGIEHCHAVT